MAEHSNAPPPSNPPLNEDGDFEDFVLSVEAIVAELEMSRPEFRNQAVHNPPPPSNPPLNEDGDFEDFVLSVEAIVAELEMSRPEFRNQPVHNRRLSYPIQIINDDDFGLERGSSISNIDFFGRDDQVNSVADMCVETDPNLVVMQECDEMDTNNLDLNLGLGLGVCSDTVNGNVYDSSWAMIDDSDESMNWSTPVNLMSGFDLNSNLDEGENVGVDDSDESMNWSTPVNLMSGFDLNSNLDEVENVGADDSDESMNWSTPVNLMSGFDLNSNLDEGENVGVTDFELGMCNALADDVVDDILDSFQSREVENNRGEIDVEYFEFEEVDGRNRIPFLAGVFFDGEGNEDVPVVGVGGGGGEVGNLVRNQESWGSELDENVSALAVRGEEWETGEGNREFRGSEPDDLWEPNDIWVQYEGSDDGNVGNYTMAVYEMMFGQSSDSEPSGKPPASKFVVENLVSVVFTEENVKKNSVLCAVCKDEFNAGEIAKKLPCSHHFHGDCILPWLEIRNTCPVCRYELPTDDPDYERERNETAARAW